MNTTTSAPAIVGYTVTGPEGTVCGYLDTENEAADLVARMARSAGPAPSTPSTP